MILRIAYLIFVMLPFTLFALPVQLVLTGFRLKGWQILPQTFMVLLAIGLGLRVKIVGAPVAGRAVLLVSNHISWLDIPALASRIPVTFVAKSEVAKYPVVGTLARLQRTIFVDRNRRTDTGRTAREMQARMGEGRAVLLFAEGTSDIGTHVLPFRSALMGAAQSALEQGSDDPVLIQPLAIAYTAISGLPLSRHERPQIAWIGDMGLGDNLRQILASGPKDITVAFGKPIPANGDRKQTARLAEQAVRAMLVALNRAQPLPKATASV